MYFHSLFEVATSVSKSRLQDTRPVRERLYQSLLQGSLGPAAHYRAPEVREPIPLEAAVGKVVFSLIIFDGGQESALRPSQREIKINING